MLWLPLAVVAARRLNPPPILAPSDWLKLLLREEPMDGEACALVVELLRLMPKEATPVEEEAAAAAAAAAAACDSRAANSDEAEWGPPVSPSRRGV